MNSKRVYYVMLALMLLSIGAMIGGVYKVNTILETRAAALTEQKAKLASLTNQQSDLKKAKKDITTYSNIYQISKSIVPQNKDQTQAVRQIANLAAQTGINIGSIAFPQSTLGGTANPAKPDATVKQSAGSAALSQLTPVTGLQGVYKLELVINSSTQDGQQATYPQLINFLTALEENRLTALVSQITISPSSQGNRKLSANSADKLTFTFGLTLDIYVKPTGK